MDRVLYYGDPINRAHPLNRGLVSDWTILPWYASGPRLIDNARRNHGTHSAVALRPIPARRPNGGYALDYTGTVSTNCGSDASLDDLDANGGLTLAWGMYLDTSATNAEFISKGTASNGGWNVFVQSNTNKTITFLKDWSTSDVSNTSALSSFVLGSLFFYTLTWDGSATGTNIKQYFNGVVSTPSASGNGGTTKSDAGNDLIWGGSTDGRMDSMAMWKRVLSATEVALLYQQWRTGNPDRFNWISTKTYFGVTAAPPPPGGKPPVPTGGVSELALVMWEQSGVF